MFPSSVPAGFSFNGLNKNYVQKVIPEERSVSGMSASSCSFVNLTCADSGCGMRTRVRSFLHIPNISVADPDPESGAFFYPWIHDAE
jgi:hypothetical protein